MAHRITFTPSAQQPITLPPTAVLPVFPSGGFAPDSFAPPPMSSSAGWAAQSTLGKRARGAQGMGMDVDTSTAGSGGAGGGAGFGVPPSGWMITPPQSASPCGTPLHGRREREGEDARGGKRPRLLHLGRSFAPSPVSASTFANTAPSPFPPHAKSQPTTPGWYRTNEEPRAGVLPGIGMDALHRAAAGLVEDVGGTGHVPVSHPPDVARGHAIGHTPSRIPSPTEAVHHTTPASSFGGVSHMHMLGFALGHHQGQGGQLPALESALVQAQRAREEGEEGMAVSPGAEGYWVEGMGRGGMGEDVAMNGSSMPLPARSRPLSPHSDYKPTQTWLNSIPDTAPPSPQQVIPATACNGFDKKQSHGQIQHQEHAMGGHDARLHDYHDPMQHDEMDDDMGADFEMEGVRDLEMGEGGVSAGQAQGKPGGGFAAAFAKHLPKTRYTMGPRPDCEKCRAGVAGHFGHWH